MSRQINFKIPVIGEGGKLVEYLNFTASQLQERGLTKDSTLYSIPILMKDRINSNHHNQQ